MHTFCFLNLQISFPVWLNADILIGPGTGTTVALGIESKLVDPDRFIPLCQEYFPTSTLSTGWTTSGVNPSAEYTPGIHLIQFNL